MLKNKNIILGITASIAAYKAAYLVRLFIKEKANVKVVMTPLAKEFITPVTLATLSKNTVLSDFFKHDDGSWNSHVELGEWADIMLIAPASANTMAKMANGICDNLLLTTYLSAKCPVAVAPAMDLDMFKHPATLKNIETLKSYNNIIIEPQTGELASGLSGKGRMTEPENIIRELNSFFCPKKKNKKRKVLITAGPTFEKIDPVRFIGNYSSGKMGYAIAEEFANYGYDVTLVSGPSNVDIKNNNIRIINVIDADEMYKKTVEYFNKSDIAILAAAVADYTPSNKKNKKIKKSDNELNIKLKPTRDILAELGKLKNKNQLLIGFALETDNEIENAKKKLKRKNLDFIVLNSLNDKGAGFMNDTNKITIIEKNNKITNFELKSKVETASDIRKKTEDLIID